MRARPKYQVFISSTYADLHLEREAVTWDILSARHIPAGMENFSASNDRGWETIKLVIDRSDYFVLLVAGRYGSLDPDEISWTEKEYDYAYNKGIPILAFIRGKKAITIDMVDDDKRSASKLRRFANKIKDRHLVKEWTKKEDLVSFVTNALNEAIKTDEDNGSRRPGWYRGDEIPDIDVYKERIDNLNREVDSRSPVIINLQSSEYDIFKMLDKTRKEIILVGANLIGLIRLPKLFSILQERMSNNDELHVKFIISTPKIIKTVAIEEAIPNLLEAAKRIFEFEMQLPPQIKSRFQAFAHPGAFSLAMVVIDPNYESGLMTINPKNSFDRAIGNRVYFALSKLSHEAAFNSLNSSVRNMIEEKQHHVSMEQLIKIYDSGPFMRYKR